MITNMMLLLEFQQAENKFVIKTLPKDIKKKWYIEKYLKSNKSRHYWDFKVIKVRKYLLIKGDTL